MRKKLLSIALCATMVAGIFTGCGSSSDTSKKDEGKSADGKITLNVINYHVGTDYAADYYEYLFDAFQKTEEGKNVEFKFEEIPTTDSYNQKIKLLISSGDLPDIVLNGGNNITALAAKSGKVTDITEYLDKDPEWKAMFSDQDLEFNSYEGKVYGIPVSKEISYIYYNKDLFKKAEEKGEAPFFILCDEIEDPHNLGAIIRTANLAGAHGVIIPKRRAVGLTSTVAKVSAGALNYTPVARVTNLSRTIDELKDKGMWFVCGDMGGELMYDLNLTGSIGLIIGNEGNGVSRLVKEKCDYIASIPMKGDIDSLNASVATGVLAFEIVRQRMGK